MTHTVEEKKQEIQDRFAQKLKAEFNTLLTAKLDEMNGIQNPDDVNWVFEYAVAISPVISKKIEAGPIAIERDIFQAAQNIKQVYDRDHQMQRDFAMHKILKHIPDLAELEDDEKKDYYLKRVEELGEEIADIYSDQMIKIDSACRENITTTAKVVALRMLTHLSSSHVSEFETLKDKGDKIKAKLREGIFKGKGNETLKNSKYTWSGVHPWSVEGFLTRIAMTVPGFKSYHCDTDKEKYGEILIRQDQINPGHPLFGWEHRRQDDKYTSVHGNSDDNLFKTKAAGFR